MKALLSKMHLHSLVAVGIYASVSSILVLYALLCSGDYCGLVVVLPVFPWVMALPELVGQSVLGYLTFVVVNVILLYTLIYYLTRQKERRKLEDEE